MLAHVGIGRLLLGHWGVLHGLLLLHRLLVLRLLGLHGGLAHAHGLLLRLLRLLRLLGLLAHLGLARLGNRLLGCRGNGLFYIAIGFVCPGGENRNIGFLAF